MNLRLLQRLTVAVFALVLAVFLGLEYYTRTQLDRTPPVLSVDSEVLEVRVGCPDEALLEGVHAHDDVDGDISHTVLIKGISPLITADTAKITYLAIDSSNNMSTLSRTVRYTNYEKPRFALERPLIFLTGSKVQLLDRLTASDVIDGDISEGIRVTTQNVDSSTPGVYTVTVQVSNSLGDVEILPLRVTMALASGVNPAVRLSDYIVYLEQGEHFDPLRYISVPTEPAAVEVDSDVDTSTPGVYDVTYTYRASTVYQTVVVR